jgi:hypothetical protein
VAESVGPVTPLARTLGTLLPRMPVGRFALVGGLAVSVRTEPRFTRDLDVVVAVPGDMEAEAFVRELVGVGFSTEVATEQTAAGRLATVRVRKGPRDPVVDLLFASTGIEPEIVAHAESLRVLAHDVPVARVGHLIAMKLLARDDRTRPQDGVDLRVLAMVASDGDWELAAAAVELIEARGFARGRDLVAALAAARA